MPFNTVILYDNGDRTVVSQRCAQRERRNVRHHSTDRWLAVGLMDAHIDLMRTLNVYLCFILTSLPVSSREDLWQRAAIYIRALIRFLSHLMQIAASVVMLATNKDFTSVLNAVSAFFVFCIVISRTLFYIISCNSRCHSLNSLITTVLSLFVMALSSWQQNVPVWNNRWLCAIKILVSDRVCLFLKLN